MAIDGWKGARMMMSIALTGPGGATELALSLGDTTFMRLSIFVWLIIIAIVIVVLALVIHAFRRRQRQRRISALQKQRRAMEAASKDLFSQRGADDIKEAVRDAGKPTTLISDGAVAYTETGEMIVFKSSAATDSNDAVAAVVERRKAADAQAPPTWSPTYSLERVIALHITGVVMFSIDDTGRITDGRDLDNELLVKLEELLEEARWLGGEMVSSVFGKDTVSLSWGEVIHLAGVTRGEPDERLDRELRWAIGDLEDAFADELWSFGGNEGSEIPRALINRLSLVFRLTADVDISKVTTRSSGGGLEVTSTVSWRHSMLEYSLGIINNGPGTVREVELCPILTKEGLLDVVTLQGIEVDTQMRFCVPEIPQDQKAVATFVFRARGPLSIKILCSLVYLRGVTKFQTINLPGRWIELVKAELVPGEPVEPERALELATQPAAFRDRSMLYLPPGVDPEKVFSGAVKLLEESMSPVVELEDDEATQIEAWFHGEVMGAGTVVTSITVLPKKGVIDLFASSTFAGVVPGCMVILRQAVERTARRHLSEVIDPELRSTVSRSGVLLFQSWGAFFEE